MEDYGLETLADDLSEVVAESHENELIDGNGNVIETTLSNEVDYEEYEEILVASEVSVSENDVSSDVVLYSSSDEGIMLTATATSYDYDITIEDLIESGANVWYLSVGNSMMYGANAYWLFPDDATLSNVNGYLLNTGTDTIVATYLGMSLDSSVSDTSSSWIAAYMYPWSCTNEVSSLINDTSNCIVTLYYRQGSDTYGYSIGSTSYNTVFTVVDEPSIGSELSSFQLGVIGCLLALVCLNVIGGLLRK